MLEICLFLLFLTLAAQKSGQEVFCIAAAQQCYNFGWLGPENLPFWGPQTMEHFPYQRLQGAMFRMQKPPKQKKMVPKPARLAKYKQRGCKTVLFVRPNLFQNPTLRTENSCRNRSK